MTLDEIKSALTGLAPEQRREVLHSLPRHPLEKRFGIRAERILDAIERSSDLTQRGIRGIIAEEVFLKDVLPKQLAGSRWKITAIEAGNDSYDAVVENQENHKVRIQVKNQRMQAGVVKIDRHRNWVVEVQKTRTGKDGQGENTRPYRFSDFDLLAVCLRPGTQDWEKFAFSLSRDLLPRKTDHKLIQIMQPIPPKLADGVWTDNLVTKLDELTGTQPETLQDLFRSVDL